MDIAQHTPPDAGRPEDTRDLQARLYREIGISAVAAALRFVTQPEPGARQPAVSDLPAYLRENDSLAA